MKNIGKDRLKAFFAKLKGLSKRNKILLITASVFIALTIAGAVTAAYFLTREEPQPQKPGVFYVVTYNYAIKSGDTEGIRLTKNWMQNLPFGTFDYEITFDAVNEDKTDSLALSNDMVITSPKGYEDWINAQIVFSYKTKEIATYNVDIIPDAVYITDAAGLRAVTPGVRNRYIVKNDIASGGSLNIGEFSGAFFGNYFKISGLDLGAGGGLFGEVRDAYIYGVCLTGVKGEIDTEDGGKYGAIANYAYNSSISGCSASGRFSVNSAGGILYAGGLIGHYDDAARTADEDAFINSADACRSDIDLTVNAGAGEVYCGGFAGAVKNATLTNIENSGNIILTAETFSYLYAGGIAGAFNKDYEAFGYSITYFDTSYNFNNSGDITVTADETGLYNTVYAGGVFGAVKNVNIYRAESGCDITVTTKGASVIAGGLSGKAENELTLTAIKMKFSGSDIFGNVLIFPKGNLYAGGVLGYGKAVTFEKTVSVATVTVSGEDPNKTIETGSVVGHEEG